MTGDTVTYVVAGIGGLVAFATVVALIFVPVVRMYPTWWQKTAATVLAGVAVFAFVIGGMYLGLRFVDNFLS
jgi:hypothetical protein